MTRYAHGAAQLMSVGRKAVTDMAKDSLTNFANVLYSEAAKQKQQAAQELEDKKKEALDKAAADAETRYNKEIKKYESGLEYEVKQAGLVKTGDTVVITAGVPLGVVGKTDMIHVVEVE